MTDKGTTQEEDRLDAEIRRLEALNHIEQQRLREPLTEDESPLLSESNILNNEVEDANVRCLENQIEETKANCPDEYNLLSGNASIENL